MNQIIFVTKYLFKANAVQAHNNVNPHVLTIESYS